MEKIKSEEIIKLLKENWELGISTEINPNCWIQKNGLCRGGESKQIHLNTFKSIKTKGIIVEEKIRDGDAFWLRRYKLKKEIENGE